MYEPRYNMVRKRLVTEHRIRDYLKDDGAEWDLLQPRRTFDRLFCRSFEEAWYASSSLAYHYLVRRRDGGYVSQKEAEGGLRRRGVLRVVGWVATSLLLVVLVAVNVAVVVFGDAIETYLSNGSVDISNEKLEATMNDGRKLAEQIEDEGIVLLRNEGNTLPLPSSTKHVNVFGWSSTEWVASGSGSAQTTGTSTTFLDALSKAGIEYNTELADMYRGFLGNRPYVSSGALNSHSSEFCRLYEPDINDRSCYSEQLLQDARDYSDTAIVVISRVSGESVDCPSQQYRVHNRDGSVDVDVTRSYLELSQEEERLLRYVGKNYKHVVVVVNSTNAMELGEVETLPGVGACLLVGTPGEVGANSIASVLLGETNPSGRTTDTYAYDLRTAASYANAGSMGEGIYTNSDGLYPDDGTLNPNVGTAETYDGVRFVDYVEGIYVGYRWYETADAEGFWNDVSNEHGRGYDGVVQYPFGYGLSYTNFSWEVVSQQPGENSSVGRDSTYQATVRVTNTGGVAGKDVVELYCTPPYYRGGIEKSATELVDYAKTKVLQPGESQDVTVEFSLDDVASYDYDDANGNGFSGYELERGTYTVQLKRDAHTLADCDNASTDLWLPETVLCGADLVTGATVQNQFTGSAARDGVSIDGSDSGADITYLTRADFRGTFPKKSDKNRAMSDSIRALNLYGSSQVEADALDYAGLVGQVSLSGVTSTASTPYYQLSESGRLTSLGRTLGADYNSDEWGALLDHLSVSDMESLVLHGYISTESIGGIGKPLTKEVDGPSQIGSFNQLSYGVGYPNATVLAQTWNETLAHEYGSQVGLEAASIGVDGWYAPSVNIHRTPMGGRNYEYYSEDPLISGTMGAAVVEGSLKSGTYCYVKHFAANNQDSYRDSLYTWMTEQSLREIYLSAFRYGVEKGVFTGIMSSYNRIGATWAGGNKALLTNVLRGEWGFKGCIITDYCDHQKYMNADQALRAGGDLYMDGVFRNGSFSYGYTQARLSAAVGTEDEAKAIDYYVNLRRAAKDVLYIWLNARETNLRYNEQVRTTVETGEASTAEEFIERPVKTGGFPVAGTVVAIVDCIAAVLIVLRVRRALVRRAGARRRGDQAKE